MSDKTNNSETYFSRKATIQVLCVRMSILLRETYNINYSSRDTNFSGLPDKKYDKTETDMWV